MKKLRLDVDALRVISFTSSAVPDGSGTVHARSGEPIGTCSNTVIPHYCYPNSDVMDCAYSVVRSCEGGCEVVGP